MGQKDPTKNPTKVVVQYDDHAKFQSTVLCSLMEHQSLVDLAIRCGNQTLHAHKVMLASHSPYLRERLEANPGTEQIIINGMEFSILKCIIEYMYCGETSVVKDNLKYVIAAAKLFQIRGLQSITVESANEIFYPPPIFINQKPKYSSSLIPFSQLAASAKNRMQLENEGIFANDDADEYMEHMPLDMNYSEDDTPISNENHKLVFGMRNMEHNYGRKLENSQVICYKTPEGELIEVPSAYYQSYADDDEYDMNEPSTSPEENLDQLENIGIPDPPYTHVEDSNDPLGVAPAEDSGNIESFGNNYYDETFSSGPGVEASVKSGIDLLLNFQAQERPDNELINYDEINTIGTNLENSQRLDSGNFDNNIGENRIKTDPYLESDEIDHDDFYDAIDPVFTNHSHYPENEHILSPNGDINIGNMSEMPLDSSQEGDTDVDEVAEMLMKIEAPSGSY